MIRFLAEEPLPTEISTIRSLLVDAFEGDFSESDWEHTCSGVRFLGLADDKIISHGAIITRRMWINQTEYHVGYLEGIAVRPDLWRRGFGSKLIMEMTQYCEANFPISLLSTGEKDFYSRFGWKDFAGKSYVKHSGELIRTEEDDDSLMYLIGKSPITEPLHQLICEARTGDPW